LGKPTLKQILDAQKRQVLVGKTYLNLAQGLARADRAVFQGSETFFGLTIDGSLELAQMTVARLYDKTKGAVTLPAMLAQARNHAHQFQRGTLPEVQMAIAKSEKTVRNLEPVLAAVRKRRNEWLAHLDPRTIADPKALSDKAKLTIPDLERVFKETESVLLELSSLYDGTFGELRFLGGDDYKSALEWIRKAKCEFIDRYEKEFGVSYDGSRPKKFTRNNFKMR
jgi:AbiU2